MRAVILIGGKGTRLRPFTIDTPKPLLPVLNRPFLHYQFEILRAHGIKDVILCTGYQSAAFRRSLGSGRASGVRLRYVVEREPLGTGGALKNAELLLASGEPFLVLNGDVLNTLDIAAFLRHHKKQDASVTIALTKVKDPTLYGLVKTDLSGRIREFLEKPSWDEIEANTINAGAYIFDPSVLAQIPGGVPFSLERQLFPHLVASGSRVFAFVSAGYWIDIGTVERYRRVHLDILGGHTPFKPSGSRKGRLLMGSGVKVGKELTYGGGPGTIVLGPGTTVGDFVRFSGSVCVGPRCAIGKGAWLADCVVLEGTRVGDGARLERCVVGAGCRIGAQAALTEDAALAGGSEVRSFSLL
ncbi:MAG: NDP-sugar synthase [Elusimicrobia bacterium]|nr:NDP-sugar synthase [Elusimicrobiota bacterium]